MYAQIWCFNARLHRFAENIDEARNIYKYIKHEGIGSMFAYVYAGWAKLEFLAGRLDKAKQIIAEGMQRKGTVSQQATNTTR